MTPSRRMFLGWLSLTLTGCTTLRPSPSDPQAWWTGRLALNIQSDPPQSWSASFELQGSAQQGEMLLLSPLGNTLARLTWTPQSAMLLQGNQHIQGPSLQALSEKLAGTDLPIPALFDWLAGLPTTAKGWQADLSGHAQGRLMAQRLTPSPAAVLRILLDR